MLQSLREHASSWVVKILFGLLILSFGLWGINDIFLGERDPTVAKVSGTKITYNQLSEVLRMEVWRLQPLFGESLDRERAKQMGLLDLALDKLVDRAVYARAVSDFGLMVNDDMVRRHVLNEPAFQNQAGQFDRFVFQQALQQNGMSEGTYIGGLHRDLASNQLIGAVVAGTPAPASLLESLQRYREEGRIADILPVPTVQSATPPIPDDAAVADFYKANIERFMTPDTRTVRVATITPAALIQDGSVPDDQVKAAYDSRIAAFTVPERRDVDQAVLQDEATAKQVSDLLGQGKALPDALTEAKAGVGVIKFGWVERPDLIGEIGDAAFALNAKQHSAPIKSALGFHIVVVNGIEAGSVRPFEEVRDALRKSMIEDAAANQAHEMAIKLEDALVAGISLEDAANQVGIKLVPLPAFDNNGLTAEGKPASVLTAQTRFMQAAFATPQGQDSQLIELPDNVFTVLHVDQITPPAAKPLDEIKTDVIALWQQNERLKAAQARAEAIVQRVAKGESIAAIAEAEQLKLSTSPVFTRAPSPTDIGLPESVKGRLFDAKVGEAAAGESEDGYVVGVLKEIKPAPELSAEARNQLSLQLGQSLGEDLLDQLSMALRARYDVEIRRNVIDSRF